METNHIEITRACPICTASADRLRVTVEGGIPLVRCGRCGWAFTWWSEENAARDPKAFNDPEILAGIFNDTESIVEDYFTTPTPTETSQ